MKSEDTVSLARENTISWDKCCKNLKMSRRKKKLENYQHPEKFWHIFLNGLGYEIIAYDLHNCIIVLLYCNFFRSIFISFSYKWSFIQFFQAVFFLATIIRYIIVAQRSLIYFLSFIQLAVVDELCPSRLSSLSYVLSLFIFSV